MYNLTINLLNCFFHISILKVNLILKGFLKSLHNIIVPSEMLELK